jgi:hypothetical protein
MRTAFSSRSRARLAAALFGACALVGAMPAPASAVDNFTPAVVNVTLEAGESITIDKVLHLDALPGAADILIAIDTTGSMDTAIAQAKAQATDLCNDVQAVIPGARFAVWDFRDVPDRPGTNGILKSLNTFTSNCAAVQAAINPMGASGGGDAPEAYNPVFHEAYSDPVLNASRNPNAVQFLVVLGDAAPHNVPAPAVAPACGSNTVDLSGFNSDTEIPALDARDVTLLMIFYSSSGASTNLTCYQQLAGGTGGNAVNGGEDLSDDIIGQIQDAAAEVDEVLLVVSAGCPLGITFKPPNPPAYGPFTAPVDIGFQENITAPTVPGGYACTVTAVVDGTPRAVQQVRATVTAGPAASLELEPAADTNTVDDEHCVIAQVEDEFGNPNPGITVRFSVTPTVGRSPSSGSAVTNASGRAMFCYSSALPGADVINAYADVDNDNVQDAEEPFDAATKLWVVPTSTPGCKITYGGRITAANGDKATFGGNAQVKKNGSLTGQEEYQDHGPAADMNVHSINVLAISCPDTSPLEASIFGQATIDGTGSVDYRIDVTDVAEPGSGVDTYRIRLSNGYDSGVQVLSGGNIQIHK